MVDQHPNLDTHLQIEYAVVAIDAVKEYEDDDEADDFYDAALMHWKMLVVIPSM